MAFRGLTERASRDPRGSVRAGRPAASSRSRIRAARIGTTRPSVTARSRVARARATYDAQGLRRVGGDVLEVGPDGAEVATDDRPGQRGVALLEGVVEGGGEQRAQGAGRVAAPAAERISIASVTRVTRWLAPCARPAW